MTPLYLDFKLTTHASLSAAIKMRAKQRLMHRRFTVPPMMISAPDASLICAGDAGSDSLIVRRFAAYFWFSAR